MLHTKMERIGHIKEVEQDYSNNSNNEVSKGNITKSVKRSKTLFVVEKSSICQRLDKSTGRFEFFCVKCNKTFSRIDSLKRHRRSPCNNGEKKKKSNESQDSLLSCDNCSASFFKKSRLVAHKQKPCDSNLIKRETCPFPGCALKFTRRLEMRKHLSISHGFDNIVEEFTFNSWEEFQTWKESMEASTFSYGSLRSGVKQTTMCNLYYFVCQFDQPNTLKRKENKTSRVKIGGCVPHKTCPSRIRVKEYISDSLHQLKVTHYKSHNHPLNFKDTFHQPYPDSTRSYIDCSVQSGVSDSQILHNITGTLGQRTGKKMLPNKKYYMKTKYILNRRWQLDQAKKRYAKDAKALDSIVKKLSKEDFNPVVVYKPQGVTNTVIGSAATFDSDVFILGLRTQRQKEIMLDGAKRILCFDTTLNTNLYDFFLITLIVPDQFGRGYPVAHFITSEQDAPIITYCFKELISSIDNLVVNAVMTDDDSVHRVVVPSVFGQKLPHLLCKRHIFRNWKSSINSKIKDPFLKQNILKILSVLLEERNQKNFQLYLNSFQNNYSLHCPTFLDYFKNEYLDKPEQWAMCYRDFRYGNLDLTKLCEGFHSHLKENKPSLKSQNTMEHLVTALLKMEKEQFLLHQSQIFISPENKLLESDSRHERGLGIPDDSVFQETASKWSVHLKTKSVSYFVNKINDKCSLSDHCFYKCKYRPCKGLCSHMYHCTCPDLALCEHIHKVHSLLTRQSLLTVFRNEVISSYDSDGSLEAQNDKAIVQPSDNFPPSLTDKEPEEINCSQYLSKIQTFLDDENCQPSVLLQIKETLKTLALNCQGEAKGLILAKM